MHVFGQRWVGHSAAIRNDGIGRLGKKEGRCSFVLPHLTDVLNVVAADAPDAANRKYFVDSCNRDRGLWRGQNDVAAVGHDELAVRYHYGWRMARSRNKTAREKMAVRISCDA